MASVALVTTEHWLDLVRAEKTPSASWQTTSAKGGFPEVAINDGGLAAADRTLWFDGYVTTYLERDLRDLAAVADLGDFQRLMKAAALRNGNLLNQSELGRDVQLPAMTVHRYPNLLETSYQIVRLEPYAAACMPLSYQTGRLQEDCDNRRRHEVA